MAVHSTPFDISHKYKRKKQYRSNDHNSSISPISSNLFDPEDEPVGPLFGNLTSQMGEDWSTASLNVFNENSRSEQSKTRHSFSGSGFLSKFFSGRLSNGSLFETRSVCTPTSNRKNSITSMFQFRSSNPFDSAKSKLSRLFRSHDTTFKPPGKKGSSSLFRIESDLGKMSLSSDTKNKNVGDSGVQDSQSWVWQEIAGGMTPNGDGDMTGSNNREMFSFGDSGVSGCEFEHEEPEDIFGPINVSDNVFEEMFTHPSNNSAMSSKKGRKLNLPFNNIRPWKFRSGGKQSCDNKIEEITDI